MCPGPERGRGWLLASMTSGEAAIKMKVAKSTSPMIGLRYSIIHVGQRLSPTLNPKNSTIASKNEISMTSFRFVVSATCFLPLSFLERFRDLGILLFSRFGYVIELTLFTSACADFANKLFCIMQIPIIVPSTKPTVSAR